MSRATGLREAAGKETDGARRDALFAEALEIEENWREGGTLRVAAGKNSIRMVLLLIVNLHKAIWFPITRLMEIYASIGMVRLSLVKGGAEILSRAIESIGPDKVKTVSAQLGNTNLEAFRAATSTGLSGEQTVWSTPLGKTMKTLGFRVVEVSGFNVKFLQ